MGRGCPTGHEYCEKVEPPSQCLPVPPALGQAACGCAQSLGMLTGCWRAGSTLGILPVLWDCSAPPMDSEPASVYEVSPLFRLSRALCGENKET